MRPRDPRQSTSRPSTYSRAEHTMGEIAPDIYLETQYPGGNVSLVDTGRGVICIDLPMMPDDVRQWLDMISCRPHHVGHSQGSNPATAGCFSQRSHGKRAPLEADQREQQWRIRCVPHGCPGQATQQETPKAPVSVVYLETPTRLAGRCTICSVGVGLANQDSRTRPLAGQKADLTCLPHRA